MPVKKKCFVAIWVVLIVGTAVISSRAQNKSANVLYAAPSHLILAGDERGDGEEGLRSLLTEDFYPIGWSKDGKFAYYTEPADEACGCYFGNLIIQDMRTDKILWSNFHEGSEEKVEDIKTHWRKNQKLFSRKLAEYGIQANKNFQPLKMPLKIGADAVNIDLFSDVAITEDAYNSKGSVIVKLISKEKGSKIVYQKTYNGTGYDGVMGAEIGAVLQSPFEQRVAVILVETKRGWEGPPNVTDIRIIGATLTNAFR